MMKYALLYTVYVDDVRFMLYVMNHFLDLKCLGFLDGVVGNCCHLATLTGFLNKDFCLWNFNEVR